MTCPHCGIAILPAEQWRQSTHDGGASAIAADLYIVAENCPACGRLFIVREDGIFFSGEWLAGVARILWPLGGKQGRAAAAEVPRELASLYEEAALVLELSPRASAALSRRCLSQLLQQQFGAHQRELANQIKHVVDTGNLPAHLADSLHSVAAVGNIATHTQKSVTTGEVVDVEPWEADWNLDALENLFEFCFIGPALAAARKAKLNQKQQAIGKPPVP
jgi:predicted RNA-binding Zn-ribbon protein involved in translation (DUF1610 family)